MVRRFIAVASLVKEHVLLGTDFNSCSTWALGHRLNSCGTQAKLLQAMWDLPGPGVEPMSPALAGGQVDSLPLSHQRSPSSETFRVKQNLQRAQKHGKIFLVEGRPWARTLSLAVS